VIAVDKNDPLLNYPLGGKYAKGNPDLPIAETKVPRNFMHAIFLWAKCIIISVGISFFWAIDLIAA
jgi:hypothetical protein